MTSNGPAHGADRPHGGTPDEYHVTTAPRHLARFATEADASTGDPVLAGPFGQLLSRAAFIAATDRREAAAVRRLWEAMTAHRAGLLAARGEVSLWDEGLLYNVARQFLRWAGNPVCAGCGAHIATPVDAERVQFANVRNRTRFDALLCRMDGELTGPRNPCGQRLAATRKAAGLSMVVTWCGPLAADHVRDFRDFVATRDGELVRAGGLA